MNYKKLVALLSMVFLVVSFAKAVDEKYIGATKCKMCHNKQFTIWGKSPHAKAMASLTGTDATNKKCLNCHSTAASVDQAFVSTITVEEGVSCESCHGPGSAYRTIPKMKNKQEAMKIGLIEPKEAVCVKCHNSESPNFKGFNYAEYIQKENFKHNNPPTPAPN